MMREELHLTIDLRTWQGRLLKVCACLGWLRIGEWAGRRLVDRMMREQLGGRR